MWWIGQVGLDKNSPRRFWRPLAKSIVSEPVAVRQTDEYKDFGIPVVERVKISSNVELKGVFRPLNSAGKVEFWEVPNPLADLVKMVVPDIEFALRVQGVISYYRQPVELWFGRAYFIESSLVVERHNLSLDGLIKASGDFTADLYRIFDVK